MTYKTFKEEYIGINAFARSGQKLKGVKKIIMHWTANAGATADNHKRYFNNLRGTYASAHIFADRTEAIAIIPLDEVTYQANERHCQIPELYATDYRTGYAGNANLLCIGIEMCVEKDGTIHKETIERAEAVAEELCEKYHLDPMKDIIRHHDVTGKNCPAPWVAHPSDFKAFKQAVNARVNGTKKPVSKNDKPVATKDLIKGKDVMGTLLIEAEELNVRKNAHFESAIDHVAKKGDKFKVYDEKNGMYLVGDDQWVSAHEKYSKFTKAKPKESKPKAPAKPKASAKKEYLVLPKTADAWNVYPTDKAPVKANASGVLNPKKFGGLEYEVLGKPQADVYTIKTGNFGKVNIYAGKETGAKIVKK